MQIYSKSLVDKESLIKQYYFIDVCRFICALLVVAIHISPFGTYNTYVDRIVRWYLARLAVPFYFVVSGYFLFRKTSYSDIDVKIPLLYAFRIFKLYVIWTIIYLPWIWYHQIKNDSEGVVHGWLTWFKNCIFIGSYTHLWYLNAVVIATLILTFLIKKGTKVRTILLMALLMYAIGLLPQSYTMLLEPLRDWGWVWKFLKNVQKMIGTTRNGIFEGFLFMGIGMYFAYKPIVIKMKTAVIGFLGSVMLLGVEIFILISNGWTKPCDMYIFLVPSVFFMFYVATHIGLKSNTIYKHLRELGNLIFYLNLFLYPIVQKVLILFGSITGRYYNESNNSLLVYCCDIILTGIVSECIIALSNVEKFKWLKNLYA